MSRDTSCHIGHCVATTVIMIMAHDWAVQSRHWHRLRNNPNTLWSWASLSYLIDKLRQEGRMKCCGWILSSPRIACLVSSSPCSFIVSIRQCSHLPCKLGYLWRQSWNARRTCSVSRPPCFDPQLIFFGPKLAWLITYYLNVEVLLHKVAGWNPHGFLGQNPAISFCHKCTMKQHETPLLSLPKHFKNYEIPLFWCFRDLCR